jgi:hypothetical protein
MGTAEPTLKVTSLDDIRQQVERWRETRPHAHSPMPDALWAAAAAAARRHGLYAAARTLHVDYGALKKHVETRKASRHGTAAATFIELTPMTSRDANGATCVIEIEGPEGTKRLRLGGLASGDLLVLAQAVWSAA